MRKTKMHKELKSIFIENEGYLFFDYATLTLVEENGFKSWNINLEGASSKLTEFMLRLDKVNLQMTSEDEKEYSGTVLINGNGFLGTGKLNGYDE